MANHSSLAGVAIAAVLALTIGCCGETWAQDLKLAQISVEAVFKNSVKVKAALREINKIESETVPRVNGLQAEAEKIRERFDKEKDSLKPEEKEKLQKEFSTKLDEARALQQALKAKVAVKSRSLQNAFRTELEQMVALVAKEEGYTAVFPKESFLYSTGVPDITEKVIKAFDAKAAFGEKP